MNAAKWEQSLHDRIAELELQLSRARRRVTYQRWRAEMWKRRAVSSTPLHAEHSGQPARKPHGLQR